jgi:hypothetical protein
MGSDSIPCILLGFLIGFISFYYYIPYVLIFFLLIHIIGTLYSETNLGRMKNLIKIFIEIFQKIIKYLYNWIFNSIFRRTSSEVLGTKTIPKKYQYNFHLKPTNDLRLQQV